MFRQEGVAQFYCVYSCPICDAFSVRHNSTKTLSFLLTHHAQHLYRGSPSTGPCLSMRARISAFGHADCGMVLPTLLPGPIEICCEKLLSNCYSWSGGISRVGPSQIENTTISSNLPRLSVSLARPAFPGLDREQHDFIRMTSTFSRAVPSFSQI